jgi:hypothetical protein
MHGTIQHWKRPRDFPSLQMDVHNLEGHHLVMGLGILLLLSRTEWASQASSKSAAAFGLTEGEGQFQFFSLMQPGTQWWEHHYFGD